MTIARKRILVVIFAVAWAAVLPIGMAAEQPATTVAQNPMEPVARLVGGEWRGQFKLPNGDSLSIRNVFEWGLGGRILKAKYYAVTEGVERQVYEGIWSWHPTEKKIIFQEYSTRSSLVAGSVEPVEDGLALAWTEYSNNSVTQYRETFRFPDNDHYLSQAYKKNEDGSERLVVEGSFERVTTEAASAETPAWQRALRKEVTVAAPLAEVWKAWTTTDGVKTFFGPEARIEAVIGGPYEIYFATTAPEGLRGSEGCKVQSVVPLQLFAFEWNAPPTIPAIRNSGLHTLVTIRLHEEGPDQTRVEMIHTGWGQGEDWDKTYAYFDKAWDAVLSNLEYRYRVGPVEFPGHFIRAGHESGPAK